MNERDIMKFTMVELVVICLISAILGSLFRFSLDPDVLKAEVLRGRQILYTAEYAYQAGRDGKDKDVVMHYIGTQIIQQPGWEPDMNK